jgi:diadenosine tetraphosphate (Ap4A) HIT family hydrolase
LVGWKYMTLIYSTENFIVEAPEKPHVTRMDGGHIKICPKIKLVDRTELSPKLAIELMRLTIATGEAMSTALNRRGIDVGRINYQDNGNWSVFSPEGPYLHIHLYGRAKSAKINKYGDACSFPQIDTGFYDEFEPLNQGDIQEIKEEIETLFKKDKYKDENWKI